MTIEMAGVQERAHAKINLSLHVLYRREDGFHEIETLIAPITLHDSLHLEIADHFQFQCDDPTLSTGEDNLVVRAARVFFGETKIPPCVSIALEKNIPHGAGLGGGSSDAAAALRGLNRLFAKNLSPEKLNELAALIGSDVPFFLHGGVAICRGRGEIVEPVLLSAPVDVVLLKPAFGVATAAAYARWSDAKKLPGVDYSKQEFQNQIFVNELERPVFENLPFLAVMKSWLLRQPEVAVALLSGSGSTLFAVARSNADKEELAKRARGELDPALWISTARTS